MKISQNERSGMIALALIAIALMAASLLFRHFRVSSGGDDVVINVIESDKDSLRRDTSDIRSDVTVGKKKKKKNNKKGSRSSETSREASRRFLDDQIETRQKVPAENN